MQQFTYNVTFDHSPQDGEGNQGENIPGNTFQEEAMTGAKALRQALTWHIEGT